MLVIACVAIIVVGPKDLPGMLRSLGKTIGNVKRMASDFQRQFNDAIKESELDEIADMAKNKTIAPLDDAKNAMQDFADTMREPLGDDLEAEAKATAPKTEAKPSASKTATNKAGTKSAATRKTPAKKAKTTKSGAGRVAANKPAKSSKSAKSTT